MDTSTATGGTNEKSTEKSFGVVAPQVSLPKSGGAIRGMGEKFSANPVTGTGSMSVPIAASPGRGGFGPQLSLSYDSGAGNGPFGLGWNLSLPSITRKTEKGLPRYQDGDESDVFILSGSEDLVRLGLAFDDDTRSYLVQHYRPRIEGLFARIEHWIRKGNATETFWRTISKDNITTWYGRNINSRIADPADASRVFSWLISESYDNKGNVVVYEYVAENDINVDLAQANERNRSRTANRYLRKIKYGNTPSQLDPAFQVGVTWRFEVQFDYGGESYKEDKPDLDGNVFAHVKKQLPIVMDWPVRSDPQSSFRSGFEVRTYRLCHRVMMFHRFTELLGDELQLVRSTDINYAADSIATRVLSITHCSYGHATIETEPLSTRRYLKKILPPLEFSYTEPVIDGTIRNLDAESLENLPYGFDGANYQWVDLDGEGLSGILTEQGDGWFYKRNLAPLNLELENNVERARAKFAPIELIATIPNRSIVGGAAQFMDLAGDGEIDLVTLDGPTPGFYERDANGGWQSFRAFISRLNRNTRDPNLKFVDLDGDGHADILITEDDALTWHPSLGEDGFGPAQRRFKERDEELGPALVFADGTQSIYLADMSGDGLADLVRIRNGGICYWPNLGYGLFGAKVTMDNSPWFDAPDQFDQKRIYLADIDGSGVTDIIYLHGNGVQLYFNQSGNGWSLVQDVPGFPRIDNSSSVTVVDLLGNGTACLVWSSPLPGYVHQPMKYVDLMSGQKPHLLISVRNNLGATTTIDYTPSTRFYLQDKLAGRPWITKLPFPVHCVSKVSTFDKWRNTTFSSTYSYHHGYFDGAEREFRGFGRVEQVDIESFDKFAAGNKSSPYIADDLTLYQPPIKTITWFHTGATLDRVRILKQFQTEYFPNSLAALPGYSAQLIGFDEKSLSEPELDTQGLTADEWCQALRACKGMTLRQEVYELSVDQLEVGKLIPVRLFSTSTHNCNIRLLQPKANNRHAVFLVTESEALSYHYELDLRPITFPLAGGSIVSLAPDPRVSHTLNLMFDEYGNIQQSVAVAYKRTKQFSDADLAEHFDLIRSVQAEQHLAYSETLYTDDAVEPKVGSSAKQDYRLRLPAEVQTFELTGFKPAHGAYFDPADFHQHALSETLPNQGATNVGTLTYHQQPTNGPQKRKVEHALTLFFSDDLKQPLPHGKLNHLGLVYESYKLALTKDLLNATLGAKFDPAVQTRLNDPALSGYRQGVALLGAAGVDQWWMSSGVAGFAPDAAQHFYLPERYTDPFDNVTTLKYDDKYDLFIQSSTDAMSNTTTVKKFDYRVLAPSEMQDINDNLSEVYFDVLGLPAAMAVKGKGSEGDNLTGFNDVLANPALTDLIAFFNQTDLDETQARKWLGNATARHIYYFGEVIKNGKTVWGEHPACACGILRETHVSQLVQNEQSAIQAAFEYSDGMGSVVVKKVQAEPEKIGQPLRWVANGKTILNNKSKPVKQYEPYFSSVGHQYEEPLEEGVTPVIYYDSAGRVIRTEMPDGSYSRVEFSPWHVQTFDQNDTVKEADNAWFAKNSVGTNEQKRAAKLAAEHANTPSLTILDSLGRNVISITHNRFKNPSNILIDEKHITFTKLDAEGKPLWIRDARNNLVMQYITPPVANNQSADPTNFVPCYDIPGNLLYQHSMDAGDRWMLNDAAGKPMLGWNSRGHIFRNDYDKLHRPTASFVKGADPVDKTKIIQFGKTIYGDTPANGLADAKQLNLRGKPYQHFDTAGVVTGNAKNPATNQNEAFDFKGNPLRSTRQLVKDYQATPDWSQNPVLENEIFTSSTQYDALNRPIQMVAPHSNKPSALFNIIQHSYNEAGLLEKVNVWLSKNAEPTGLRNPATATLNAVTNIDYDAKGQRVKIEYNEAGHPIVTQYNYDKETFRLKHLLTIRPNHPDANTRTLQDLSYTYDPVGNITEIRDAAQQAVFFDNSKIDPSNSYIYDALYRLIHAEGREHATQNNLQRDSKRFEPILGIPSPNNPEALQRYKEDYDYDSVGNILGMHHTGGDNARWIRWYQYALDSNQLLATKSPGDANKLPFYTATPGYNAKYTYDAHGNMKSMSHLPIMEWNFKDQLQASQQQVVNGGTGEKTYYVYDGGGERVRKITELQNGKLKDERIYLGGFEVYRKYSGANNAVVLERETLHVMDDKQRIALVETRTLNTANNDPAPQQSIRYQLSNHLGSATLELNEFAQVISYEEFHPYGTTAFCAGRSAAEVSLKRYRYTGKERDEETGFSYHSARYYMAWISRWTSCDPIGLADGLNIYQYAGNRPIGSTDSTGMQEQNAHTSGSMPSKPSASLGSVGLPSDCRVTNTDLDKFKPSLEPMADPIEQAAKVHGQTQARLHELQRELGELNQSFQQGIPIYPWNLEHYVPAQVMKAKSEEIYEAINAGLAEINPDTGLAESSGFLNAVESGLIIDEKDQERFLAIAARERRTTEVEIGLIRSAKFALAMLPGEGAAGSVFARAPASASAVLTGLDHVAAAAGATGRWTNVIENMSTRAIRFQEAVIASIGEGIRAGTSFMQNGTKFDGLDAARKVLVDAKGPGYGNFINRKTGGFYDWFAGKTALVDQAHRQFIAAQGMKIEWVFAEKNALDVTKELLRSKLTNAEFKAFTFKLF